jgi:hypothetical protein
MAYVDLNPIRAKIAKTPEESAHNSIQKRNHAIKQQKDQPHDLMPFVGNPRQGMPKGISYSLKDYCELVDTTGLCIREDKMGYIENRKFPILTRLGLAAEQWLHLTTEFEKHFFYAAGAEQMMKQFKAHTHHKQPLGMGKARELLNQA